MTHLSIRFLIGLSAASDPPGQYARKPQWSKYEERAFKATEILAPHYPALSSVRGVGYWKGQAEPNLIVETIVPYNENPEPEQYVARQIADEIARALDQESVALAVSEVRFTLEGPHGTV